MFFTAFWIPLAFCMMIGWVATTWIRARHGYPIDDGAGGHLYKAGLDSRGVTTSSEAADRDAAIRRLEERVRVLERIVTDDSARLSAEIERLRG